MKRAKTIWIALALMILLCPLGLLVPEMAGSGAAWGEWSAAELQQMTGFMSCEFQNMAAQWKAPLAGYSIECIDASPAGRGIAYMLSALAGTALVLVLVTVIGRWCVRNRDAGNS